MLPLFGAWLRIFVQFLPLAVPLLRKLASRALIQQAHPISLMIAVSQTSHRKQSM